MNTYMQEIYDTVLPDMAAHDIEDTIPNRIAYLSGLQDAWNEDTTKSPEKSMYTMALAFELLNLKLKNIFSA
jgi:hypothetical protein